ncbi:hypothetical protein, partial [Mesorhizobium amorphae]|uniref:hypothetical protein n=1 Tax=Mesorhizobium amorphae TaxID=71433 RepID=UPI001AEBCE0F
TTDAHTRASQATPHDVGANIFPPFTLGAEQSNKINAKRFPRTGLISGHFMPKHAQWKKVQRN